MSQVKNIILLVILTISIVKCTATTDNNRRNKGPPPKPKRVYGGEPTTIDKAPFLVTLMDYEDCESTSYGEPVCGASIITNQWLLTAAHCLVGKKVNETKIRTGATGRYCGRQYHIKRFLTHPKFKTHHYTLTDDIGLIELVKPLPKIAGKQRPIPLALPTYIPKVGQNLKIFGFGRIGEDLEGSPVIKTALLPIIDLTVCKNAYGNFDPISDKQICAGNGPSTCNGDSGGPAVFEGRLVGIVSSGFKCDTAHIPAVFTAVHKYLSWIKKYVKV